LSDNHNNRIISFADDTSVTVWTENYEDLFLKANVLMEKIHKWLCLNKLSLNINKTKFICYSWISSSGHNASQIVLHFPKCTQQDCTCPTLENVNTYKYLGVIIDHKMSWKPHVDYLLGKLRFCLLIMARLRKVCGLRVLRLIYFSFFQSYMQYCPVVYGNAFQTTLQPLLILQKKCVKLMTNAPFLASSFPIFQSLKLLPFKCLYLFRVLLYVQKHLIDLDVQRSISNRNVQYRQLSRYYTSRGQRCIKYRAIKIMNVLNSEYNILELNRKTLKTKSLEIMSHVTFI